jgi:hypothetical protein
MRQLFLIALVAIVAQIATAQINVSPIEQVSLNVGKFKPENLALLKKTTTIFILRKSEEEEKEAYQKLLDSAWTYTPIKVITLAEWQHYLNSKEYSFLTIDGFTYGSSLTVYLHLWMLDPKGKSKKNPDKLTFARLELAPSQKTRASFKTVEDLYKTGEFQNWEIATMVNNLKVVNQYLTNGETRWLFSDEVDATDIKKLKKEVLYMPDNVLIGLALFAGNESKKQDETKVMEKYQFKYKIVTMDELNEKNLTDEKPFYYLIYTQATGKFVTIQNSKTGKIIYSAYSAMGSRMKDTDWTKLMYAMNK